MRQGILARIDDTAERARWPRFESKAASHGIGSCLALPLIADGKPVGALALALRLSSYAALTDQLRSSVASRTVIDQAIGVIMAQERCGQVRAFSLLRSASQNRNVKLRDIAAAIVTSVSGEPPQPPVFEVGWASGGGGLPISDSGTVG
jgi:transcriptional regulator with GAF, ATPase, and Fis domain